MAEFVRIDRLLLDRGLVSSRTRAQALIGEGAVSVGGQTVKKPSEKFPDDADIMLSDSDLLRYVGRGAYKLGAALDAFGVDPRGMTAVDIGASTGGFTQRLLEGGARHVYAVDSGHGQLVPPLLSDPRVTSIEGFNARGLTAAVLTEECDLAVMDVSFISQRLLYEAVSKTLTADGVFISLIKPQFEVGRSAIGRGGIVRDKDAHVRAVSELFGSAAENGFMPQGLIMSPIKGGDGNTEYLACFRRCAEGAAFVPDLKMIKEVVYEA